MTETAGGPRVDLDDLNALAELDSQDVLGAVERFGDQVREGWEIGVGTEGLPNAEGIDSIVVLGMGGSGVSGDVIASVVEPRLPFPLRTIKTYGPLPEWVGRNTLVFAVSYSGSTEETIAALEEAIGRGARIVTVSSGGPLAELARKNGLAHVAVPSGLQPRASLGYLTMPILGVLVQIGLVPEPRGDIEDAVEMLRELGDLCHRKVPSAENPAKDLARRMFGRVPVIYGGSGPGATAAYRFKCDINEYGKSPAFWHALPEMDHNEIVGWNVLSDLTKDRFVLILLRTSDDHERVDLRFEITRSLVGDEFAEVVEVPAKGTTAMARLFSLIMLTQLAAIYLGLAYGVDPGPVDVIQRLKAELSDR